MSGKLRVIFCIPGKSFSSNFLQAWTSLISACMDINIEPILCNRYSSVVHFARSACLGATVSAGPMQKPFQGRVPYDVIVWIDSDIVFTPEQVFQLINSPHPITCGAYLMEDRRFFPIVKHWDLEYFKKHECFEFLSPSDVEKYQSGNSANLYMEVDYAGMGFMAIKNGVIEHLEYPWFYRPAEVITLDYGTVWKDMSSEDTAFCHNLREKGFKIMYDTRIRVGHEKTFVI